MAENTTHDDAGSNTTASFKSTSVQTSGIGTAAPYSRAYNPLSEFASYNYQISLYMVSPEALNNFHTFGRTKLDIASNGSSGFMLVAQTGGKHGNVVPGLELDVYIENLVIKQVTAGQGTGNSLGAENYTFDLVEPHSISFLTKLVQARNVLKRNSSMMGKAPTNLDPIENFFMLAIRFYGYDISGNIITGDRYTSADKSVQDNQAMFERYFPIKIQHFSSKFGTSVNTYKITAAPANGHYSKSVKARVKGELSVTGSTVYEVLNSVMEEQTKRESQLAKETSSKFYPSYTISFSGFDEVIKNAYVVNPSVDKTKSRSTASAATNTTETNEATAIKSVLNLSTKNYTFKNDDPLTRVIEHVISNSTYVTDSLIKLNKQDEICLADPRSNRQITNSRPKEFEWFYINSSTAVKGFDDQTSQWIVDVHYIVNRYTVSYLPSPYLKSLFRSYSGFKSYDYVYTGTENEIISYEQEMDKTYFVIGTNTKMDPDSAAAGLPIQHGRMSNIERTADTGRNAEDVNNVRTSFYDPGSFKTAKISIMGDPDYLMQTTASSDLLSLRKRLPASDALSNTFVSASGQMLIEIRFRDVTDHDISTGLMIRNPNIQLFPQNLRSDPEFNDENDNAGIFFTVKNIFSNFRSGKFTQDLELALVDATVINNGKSKEPEKTENSTDNSTNNSTNNNSRQDTGTAPLTEREKEVVKYNAAQDSQAASVAIARIAADDDKGTIYDKTGYYAKKRTAEGSIYAKAAAERESWSKDFTTWITNITTKKAIGPTAASSSPIDSNTLLPKRN